VRPSAGTPEVGHVFANQRAALPFIAAMTANPPARRRRKRQIRRAVLVSGVVVAVLAALSGVLVGLDRLLPRVAPDWVIAHSPWIESMARAVVADPAARWRRRAAMARRLDGMGPATTASVGRLLWHPRDDVRAFAAGWLTGIGSTGAVDVVYALPPAHADRLVAGVAACAHDPASQEALRRLSGLIAQHADPVALGRATWETVGRLHALDLVRSPVVAERIASVRALLGLRQHGVLMASELTDLLRPGLSDAAVTVRVEVVQALGSCTADARVAPLLIAALGDPAPAVIDAADGTLGTRFHSLDAGDRAARAAAEDGARAHLALLINQAEAAEQPYVRHVLRSLLRNDDQRRACAAALGD